jgi:hypothetical protein
MDEIKKYFFSMGDHFKGLRQRDQIVRNFGILAIFLIIGEFFCWVKFLMLQIAQRIGRNLII